MKLGLDFGSTYSTLAAYNPATKKPEAIKNGEKENIPSVVSIDEDGRVSCGVTAKDQIGRQQNVQIYEAFKMLLTESNHDLLTRKGYQGENTPRHMAQLFLSNLFNNVVRQNNIEKLETVVACIPENWEKKTRERKMNTLDGRGILYDIIKNDLRTGRNKPIPVDTVRIITEPEAASVYFAYQYENPDNHENHETTAPIAFNGHLLLIDYGGGTLDFSLTKVSSNGKGSMEISYCDSDGAGENHPDDSGVASIGNAGIAYMQKVVLLALQDSGLISSPSEIDYAGADFLSAVINLESHLEDSNCMDEIENYFDIFGSGFADMKAVLNASDEKFLSLHYRNQKFSVTYQHLYRAYQDTIEGVLKEITDRFNPIVQKIIGFNPCSPLTGVRDDFKIALVGGFGSFYLVKKQLIDIYHLQNPAKDLRTKNITAVQRKQAVALGAALVAEERVVLQKTARYAIGLYTAGSSGQYHLHYAIKYHQIVKPGTPYFITDADDKETSSDSSEARTCNSEKRITFGGLHGNIRNFAIEFSDNLHHGGLMLIKPEFQDKLNSLPQENYWHCGFSMDKSNLITFHVVPRVLPGMETDCRSVDIPLDNYANLFDLTEVKEVND